MISEVSSARQELVAAPRVSITIPLYNEERLIGGEAARIVTDLERSGVTFELILAENGSTDDTFALAKGLVEGDTRLRLFHLPEANYGRALQVGFLSSSGECIANFSIDFADVGFLTTALSRIGEYDVVLGSKYLSRSFDRRPLVRRLGGAALSRLVQLLFGLPVEDTHGLMVFRREAVAGLVAKCQFGNEIFDTELIVRAHRAGLKILELPINVDEKRPSRVGSVRRATRMLGHFVRLRIALSREGVQ